jgi:hypothetical protein
MLLSGVVVDPAGRPVADARVALTAAPVEVPDVAVLTGEDGEFTLTVPVAGSYRVAAHGDHGLGQETVDVDSGGAAGVRLVIRP